MRRLVLLTAAVLVAGVFLLGYGFSGRNQAAVPVVIPTVVDQVREALAARYYRPVPAQVLRLGSVDAMLTALRDPYTQYLPHADYRRLQEELAGRYVGIGISVAVSRRGLAVTAVRPGPAQAAGIRVGDTIVRIGSRPTALHPHRALTCIDGLPGTRVLIEVLRPRRVLWVSVVRARLRSPDVQGRLLAYAGRRWGDLVVSAFAADTAPRLGREIDLLQRRGAAGFVLDLRGDPGGLLDEAVAVASLFLDRGSVVSLRGLHRRPVLYDVLGGVATRLPLVVLVDHGTASSAEVVAAALRDHRRATLVGARTYGKALVQAVAPLGDGGALELTVAHYYTADGADISGVGIVPDVRAVDRPGTATDEALAAALEVLARPTT